MSDLAYGAGAFLATALLTWWVRRVALSQGRLDVPNARSSHTTPTARGGGLSMAIVLCTSALALALPRAADSGALLAISIGGVLVAAVGYVDDLRGLSPLQRIAVHVTASAFAVASVAEYSPASTLLPWLPHTAVLVLLVLAVTWSINLFNFMDGIDGIATSESAFIAGASAFLALLAGAHSVWTSLAILTIGSSLGFLVWNWPPAKIFMGDVGSGFLGFWLGSLALGLHFSGTLSIWTSVTLASVFIADATATLLRRMLRGSRWHEAHRSHAYQHLARRWNSHLRVTTLVWWINVLVLLPLAYLCTLAHEAAPWIAGMAVLAMAAVFVAVGAGRDPVS